MRFWAFFLAVRAPRDLRITKNAQTAIFAKHSSSCSYNSRAIRLHTFKLHYPAFKPIKGMAENDFSPEKNASKPTSAKS